MVVVASVSNSVGPVRSILGRYLFDMGKGLYIGDVNKRVLDYLREALDSVGHGKWTVLLAWQDRLSVSGFEVIEFGGGADGRTQEIDGLIFSAR